MNKFSPGEGLDGRLLRSARALKSYFEKQLKTPIQLLTSAPVRPSGHEIQFEPSLGELGFWGVQPERILEPKDRSQVSDAFRTILGTVDRLHARREELRRMQENMELAIEEMPSNVIPLRRPSADKRPIFSSVRDKRWILRLDCLIEAAYVSEIHKMALELHSQSHRYAFVEFRDLRQEERATFNALLGLGGITLFIPDIRDLNEQEQEALLQLTTVESITRPLLVVGTLLPYAELRGEPGVNLDLLAQLARAYIKLTRPFSEYKDEGLIHYFLDSLSQNPT